ncbi:MAG: glycosyltransferase [Patescibacteria group bacterium]
MKVAIVHDYLIKLGGAERVLENLHELYPDAPVYTFLYNENKTQGKFSKWDIRPSSLNKDPIIKNKISFARALMPMAAEQFDLSEYDVVISNCHAFSKGVITKPETVHISYCHTPTRFLWFKADEAINQMGWFSRKLAPYVLNYLRIWDVQSADRVDYFLGNSKNVCQRIKKFYRRDSEILYPPVDINRFQLNENEGDYYLIVSRLEPHKKVDLAIAAFNDLDLPLKIIGDGTELNYLKSLAKENIEFLGELNDEAVVKYIYGCKAFIYPQEEDFGITSLEAQACGRPVIAYGKGGALETIVEGRTGEYFMEQSAGCLADTIRNFDPKKYKSKEIRENAEKFSETSFKNNVKKLVEKYYNEYNKNK